jgi:hypothetical protein
VKGFGLRIWPTGRTTYVFKCRPRGRGSATERVTLGDVEGLTRDDARKRATPLRTDFFAGQSLAAERAARQQAVITRPGAPRVADVADGFRAECTARARPAARLRQRRGLGRAHGSADRGATRSHGQCDHGTVSGAGAAALAGGASLGNAAGSGHAGERTSASAALPSTQRG